MFARLRQPSRSERLRNFIWPTIGWRRWLLYIRYRIVRIKGGPHSIAGGLAFGIAFSFTPFVGIHILLAVVFSRIFGFNMLAAVIGTIFGNPITLPLMWWWVFHIGKTVLGTPDEHSAAGVEMLSEEGTLDMVLYLFENFTTILFPMTIGSFLVFIPVWFVSYLILKKLLMRWQSRIASKTAAMRMKKLSS